MFTHVTQLTTFYRRVSKCQSSASSRPCNFGMYFSTHDRA